MTWPTNVKLPQPGSNSPFIRRSVRRTFGNRAIPDSNAVGGSAPPTSGQIWPRGNPS